jgi:hypothetical protein
VLDIRILNFLKFLAKFDASTFGINELDCSKYRESESVPIEKKNNGF